MKCEIFDLLRQAGKVETRDCEAEGTRSVSTDGTSRVWFFCSYHYGKLVGVLQGWRDGDSTYKNEMSARAFFKKHPEALQ